MLFSCPASAWENDSSKHLMARKQHSLTVAKVSFVTDKGDYPENLHVIFCPNKLTFYVIGSRFKTLAVILVSDF